MDIGKVDFRVKCEVYGCKNDAILRIGNPKFPQTNFYICDDCLKKLHTKLEVRYGRATENNDDKLLKILNKNTITAMAKDLDIDLDRKDTKDIIIGKIKGAIE